MPSATSAGAPHVRLVGLSKSYGSVHAVTDLTLDVGAGEMLALLGPSGCGKTTVLRMIAGLTDATRGRILIGERDVTGMPVHRRNTGMVFQGYALFPHMTAAQNVAFGLEMRKIPAAETARRVAQALELVRLDGHAERYPKELSGGQQQRVALARALAIEPAVLLLDEPMSNLDAKLRLEVRGEIRKVQQALGVTAVFVTHDQEEALTIADRLVVMNEGTIRQIGAPRELYERPRSVFVADFIGRSNVLAGRVVARDVFRTARGAEIRFDPDACSAGGTALAVRPEKIAVHAEPPQGAANMFAARVESVVYFGARTELAVVLASGDRLIAHTSNDRVELIGRHDVGQQVHLSWPADCALVVSGE